MRSWRIAIPALILLPPAPALAQPDAARAIIEQAIKAHGGEERLARNRADKVKLEGTLYSPGGTAPFVAETTVQLPAQFKTTLEVRTPDGKTHTLVHLVNGDKVTVLVDGRVDKQPDPAALAELRDIRLLDRAIRLVPLLRERGYDLAVTDDVKVNDRPAAGVRVTMRGRKEMRLYFDRELGLLVKTEHVLGDGSGKEVREERYFGDFKDVAGHKRPFKVIAFRDGKKLMEARVVDVKYFDKLDDSEFTRP
jgi:hypothetical protein